MSRLPTGENSPYTNWDFDVCFVKASGIIDGDMYYNIDDSYGRYGGLLDRNYHLHQNNGG